MKKSCRVPCRECPWVNISKHNDSWSSYVGTMEKVGQIENKEHGCHMITKDVWGYTNPISNENVCIGAKNFMSKK